MEVSKKEALLELKDLKTLFPVKTGFFNKVSNYVKAVNGIDLTI